MNQTTLHQDIADAGGYVPKDGEEFFRMTVPDASGGRGTFAPHSTGPMRITQFAAGVLTANKPLPSVAQKDGKPFHSLEPRGDHLGDDNLPAFASLNSIIAAAQCPDFGFGSDCVRDGSIKPDTKLRGVPCWRVGDSANRAVAKLKSEYAQHLAKTSDIKNRTPASRPN